MPFGDRTGPLGQGPMTGRRRGMGLARGRGRGFGMCNAAVPNDPQDIATRIGWLETVLSVLKERLATSKTEQS